MFILLNKPYGMLSQFTRSAGSRWKCLGDIPGLPPGVYAAGRLDADSEGLLMLTDDMRTRHRLMNPEFHHPRAYLAQVEGTPAFDSIWLLGSGNLVLDGHRVLPASVRLLTAEPPLPPRPVPIRFRANIPTAWIELTLTEGRNRQVRRMTAAAGHPTLRLVRTGIGSLTLDSLAPGEWREVTREEVISSLAGLASQAAQRPPRGRRGTR